MKLQKVEVEEEQDPTPNADAPTSNPSSPAMDRSLMLWGTLLAIVVAILIAGIYNITKKIYFK